MEPPRGFWASLWSFLRFLPFFFGLLLLGIIKGAILFPWACLIMTIGNSALILGLFPVHAIWTYYSIIRAKQLGPILKLVICVGIFGVLIIWPILGIFASILAGIAYGFLAPVMATFDAVGEGKSNEFLHCFLDGTWSTIKGACTVVRDIKDLLFHSYFSIMADLRLQDPPDGNPYEIRLLFLPGALLVGILGVSLDALIFTTLALYKGPIMLFKGWKRLAQDLIGREGPFLETACVPFAGLAIILWPLAVAGAVAACVLSSLPLGAYGAFVAYQESSFRMGLSYVMSSLAIFDEYTNDILDMQEGSCFPMYQYRKNESIYNTGSLSRPLSLRRQETRRDFTRATSFKNSMQELNPFKLLDSLFSECGRHGENLISQGIITCEDIEETKSGTIAKGILSVGLPAYGILQSLLRSAKSNSIGLLLSDGSEITSDNRPKHKLFDWFFEPLMVIKDQIKAENFTEEEEIYFCKMVLLRGDSKRMKSVQIPPLNDRKKAEIEAFARRLQGITKSISRYPTAKRCFDNMVNSLSKECERKSGESSNGSGKGSESNSGSVHMRRLRSIGRIMSQKSVARTRSVRFEDQIEDSANNVESIV